MTGPKSVFLSYASPDVVAASRVAAAMRAAGVEVWFDQNELRGGDLWQQSIQRQIRDCRLFLPIISRCTESRGEGYFRLEWKLAVDRSHTMASDQRFILPIVIDDTTPAGSRVPDRFHDYQWLKLPLGESTSQFSDRIIALLGDNPEPSVREQPTEVQQRNVLSQKKPSRHRARMVVGFAAVALGFAALTFLLQRRHPTVVPYSANDRRMTFAVLPFLVADQNAHTADAAAANRLAYAAALERNTLWATTVDSLAADQVAGRLHSAHEIAQELNVHFLLRGTVAKTRAGYLISLSMMDGDTERAVATDELKVDDPMETSARTSDYDAVVANLVFGALKAEVDRAISKPEGSLDVRDLTFRGYAYWSQHGGTHEAYHTAQGLLDRALKLSPNDLLALAATAEINLCDCLHAWASDLKQETDLGAVAVDRIARLYPKLPTSGFRRQILMLRGQYAEALSLADAIYQRNPDNMNALQVRTAALIHLGRASEALPSIRTLEQNSTHRSIDTLSLIAAVEYATGDNAAALKHAEAATAIMTEEQFKNTVTGGVRLIQIAAHARLGEVQKAHAFMRQFLSAVPDATTIAKIRQWIYPTADLYGFEPLFDGLRLAGVQD